MKLGLFTALYNSEPLEKVMPYLKKLGVQSLEIGTGSFPGSSHCNPAELLKSEDAIKSYKEMIVSNGLEISALSCHGNPVHPNKEVADKAHSNFEETVRLAQKLGVKTIVTFSGCPGSDPSAKRPSWVTCPWPDDFLETLDYQWNEVLIPYWKKAAVFAKEHGIRVALEMHPGFCVYNAETLLRLRKAVGDTIGANFDPSHLFWQGVDPVFAIRSLGSAIYHFHAKDTKIDPINTATNGVLDVQPYADEIKRAWLFRTVGYGNDFSVWKDIMSNLRLVGYDGVISIEHEDSLMTPNEGVEKAIEFLSKVMMFEEKGEVTWA